MTIETRSVEHSSEHFKFDLVSVGWVLGCALILLGRSSYDERNYLSLYMYVLYIYAVS